MPGWHPCAVVPRPSFSTTDGHKTRRWVKPVAFWRPLISPGTVLGPQTEGVPKRHLPVPVQGGRAPPRIGVGPVPHQEGAGGDCAAAAVTRVFSVLLAKQRLCRAERNCATCAWPR